MKYKTNLDSLSRNMCAKLGLRLGATVKPHCQGNRLMNCFRVKNSSEKRQ